jgi:hypothetical protein
MRAPIDADVIQISGFLPRNILITSGMVSSEWRTRDCRDSE